MKKYEDPVLGEVTLLKSRAAKRLSVRVHPVRGIKVTVPFLVPYAVALAFLAANRAKVQAAVRRQMQRCADVPKAEPEQIEQMRRQAKAELPVRLKELADRYGFVYNRVAVKHNSTNWGSCSTKGNINLNLNIVRLPSVLRDYILLHELCHLRHHDHGPAFHLLLEHVCTDNLLMLSDAGDVQAGEIARKAALSKAKYPVDHVCSKAIKAYPLV